MTERTRVLDGSTGNATRLICLPVSGNPYFCNRRIRVATLSGYRTNCVDARPTTCLVCQRLFNLSDGNWEVSMLPRGNTPDILQCCLRLPPDLDVSGITEHWQGLSEQLMCRSGDANRRIHISHFAPSAQRAIRWRTVSNAGRVAGMVASFMFRRSMRGCLRNSRLVRLPQASKRVKSRGVFTPYKVSVFQKICRQALNVLILSQTFSACFISSHLLAEFHSFADSIIKLKLTHHEIYRTYPFGTWCLSHRLRCQ